MPLDASDVPPLIKEALDVLGAIGKGVRKKSAGGRILTREEKQAIGKELKELGERFLAEALD